MSGWFDHIPEGIRLHIRVIPNAARNEVVGVLNDRLKIKLHSPPIDGRANTELLAFLSHLFSVPKSSLMILKGKRGREKTVLVRGMDESTLLARLQ